MTDADMKYLMDSVEAKLKKKYSREEALHSFQNAGILDKEGNFTEPYQNLGWIMERLLQAKKNEASSSEITPDIPSSAKP